MPISDDLKRSVLHIIARHIGYANRVQRKKLLKILVHECRCRLSDRIMRRAIEELRDTDPAGARICSSLDGGYYMAANLEELEAYLNTDMHRAVTIIQRVNRQRKRAGMEFTQKALF